MLDEEIKEARRNKVAGTSMMLGAVGVLIGTYAFMFWPSQSRGQCLIDMAEKANGNSTIFNALVIANCKDAH
jgi:hypothetical protein